LLDSNLVLVLSLGALLVANGLISRAAAAKRAAAESAAGEEPTSDARESA
jgi:hypothetical protein